METRKAVTISGSYRVELARMQVGACHLWVWPPEAAGNIHEVAQERRRAVFNAWPKQKKKATGRLPGHPERRRRAEDPGGGNSRKDAGGDNSQGR